MQVLNLEQEIEVIKPEMPFYSGLRDIAIGLVFVMISFRLNNFDLFVDFIGFLIIKIGINRLKPFSEHFSKAGRASNVLLFLSVFNIVNVKFKVSHVLTLHAPVFLVNARPHHGYAYIFFFIILFGLIQIIFQWRFFKYFFCGLIDISYLVNASRLGLKVTTIWMWVRIWLFCLFGAFFLVFLQSKSLFLFFILLVFTLLLLISLLRLCYIFGHLVLNKPVQNEQPD